MLLCTYGIYVTHFVNSCALGVWSLKSAPPNPNDPIQNSGCPLARKSDMRCPPLFTNGQSHMAWVLPCKQPNTGQVVPTISTKCFQVTRLLAAVTFRINFPNSPPYNLCAKWSENVYFWGSCQVIDQDQNGLSPIHFVTSFDNSKYPSAWSNTAMTLCF